MPVRREALESGEVLRELIRRFNQKPNQDNMASVLYCLRDSDVYIPVKLIADSNNPSDELSMQYPLLQSEETYFLPVFSSVETMSDNYKDNYTKIRKSFLEAIQIADRYGEEVYGIVVDAFSGPFEVNNDLYNLISSLESKID